MFLSASLVSADPSRHLIIPDGVTYIVCSDETNERVVKKLNSLTRKGVQLASLFKTGNSERQNLFVGGFMTRHISPELGVDSLNGYSKFNTQITLSQFPSVEHRGIHIKEREQYIGFSDSFSRVYDFSDESVIRKPSSKELALIWRLIGWGITEPIYVIEKDESKVVIDFDATGKKIEWMEDLSNFEFTLDIEGQEIMLKAEVVGDPGKESVVYIGKRNDSVIVVE